jgi:hypothetical protein
LCVRGSCVSACNPTCAANEVCTAKGECVGRRPEPRPKSRDTTEERTTDEKNPAPGIHTHDGFYFRIALGFGGLVASGAVRDNARDANEGSVTSLGALGELALGGTVGSGLVIGGGTWNAVPINPTMKYRTLASGETPASPEVEVSEPKVSAHGLLGPFIDWYVQPEKGLHIQAAIGLANGGYEEPGDNHDTITLWGFGGMLGVGYEWWVGEQWSMGLLARATSGSISGVDPTDKNEEHSVLFVAPGALLTFTYH